MATNSRQPSPTRTNQTKDETMTRKRNTNELQELAKKDRTTWRKFAPKLARVIATTDTNDLEQKRADYTESSAWRMVAARTLRKSPPEPKLPKLATTQRTRALWSAPSWELCSSFNPSPTWQALDDQESSTRAYGPPFYVG
jgi:hypothetical protein